MALKPLARLLCLKALAPLIAPKKEQGSGPYRRILVMRPDHLGDLLLSVPALQRLRAGLPDAHIALLVGPWNQEAAEHLTCIDEALTLPFPWFDRRPKSAPWEPYVLLRREARRLRAYAWDLALILRSDFWWGALLAAWARVPERVGFASPEASPFLTKAFPLAPDCHEALQCLMLAEAVLPPGGAAKAAPTPAFALTPEEEAFADLWLARHGDLQRLLALHPGAGAAVKLWRRERFAALAETLAGQWGTAVVVTGSASEQPLIEDIVRGASCTQVFPLVGASLGQLAAVLRRCALAIGVDSGVMHLAATLGVPTVRLYGPVDPARFGPWGEPDKHRVVTAALPCVPCNRLDFSDDELAYHPCVRAITVDAVLEAAHSLLFPVAR